MKIERYENYTNIPAETKNQAIQGKWLHFNRVYVLQVENKFAAITLNIFERIKKEIQKIFGFNYFQKVFKTIEVKLIDCKTFTPAAKIAPPVAPPAAQPHPTQTVTAPPQLPARPAAAQPQPSKPIATPQINEEQAEAVFEQAMRSFCQSLGVDPDSPELEAAFDKIEPILTQQNQKLQTDKDLQAAFNQINWGNTNPAVVQVMRSLMQGLALAASMAS